MFAPGPSKIVWTLFFYLLLQVTIYDAFILFFFKYWMKFISEATWIRRNIFLLLANLFYCFYIFECDEICTHHVTRLSCLDSLAVCDDSPNTVVLGASLPKQLPTQVCATTLGPYSHSYFMAQFNSVEYVHIAMPPSSRTLCTVKLKLSMHYKARLISLSCTD